MIINTVSDILDPVKLLMMLSSANSLSWLYFKYSGKSFIYTRKRTGPRTVHCGTPEVTGAISDDSPSRTSVCVRFDEKAEIQCIIKHILNQLESNSLLYDHQHGFRHSRSCKAQLLSFVQELPANSDKNIQTDLIIMDFNVFLETITIFLGFDSL
jgi:hypothetical protein